MIEIEMQGIEEFRKALKKAKADVREEAGRAIGKSLLRIHKAMLKRVNREPKSGDWVWSYNSKKMHQQSAPGEPPASDSGKLSGSFFWETHGLYGYVGARSIYARYLEFGDKGGKMRPRPYITPSVEEDAPRLYEDLKRIIK